MPPHLSDRCGQVPCALIRYRRDAIRSERRARASAAATAETVTSETDGVQNDTITVVDDNNVVSAAGMKLERETD